MARRAPARLCPGRHRASVAERPEGRPNRRDTRPSLAGGWAQRRVDLREVAAIELLDALGGTALVPAAVAALGRTRAEIDALNVFPVPDGDTGTNLLLTSARPSEAVAPSCPATLDADARLDALAGARCWAPAATPA